MFTIHNNYIDNIDENMDLMFHIPISLEPTYRSRDSHQGNHTRYILGMKTLGTEKNCLNISPANVQ